MARKKENNITKVGIVRVATEKFLRNGYTTTTVKSIAQELGISTGHLTFYYPTKEDLLAVLVDMLGTFQWDLMERLGQEGEDGLVTLSLELPAMAALCQENEVAQDFYISAYTQPKTLDLIRRNDARRAKDVFARYCTDWTDEMFAQAEVLVSGIEYSTLMVTEASPPMEARLGGALDQIFSIYNVPKEIRQQLIREALQQDYRALGLQIFADFLSYIQQVNEQTLEELLNPKKKEIK